MRAVLSVAMVAILSGAAAAPAETCDREFIRREAEQSFRAHRVEAVVAKRGIVTLLLGTRDGTDRFAIALYASGTRLMTSVMGEGLGEGEAARAAEPATTWWQHAELQQALVACGERLPDASGVAAKLRAAASETLQRYPSPAPSPRRGVAFVMGGAWVAFAVLLLTAGASGSGRITTLLALFGVAFLLRWMLSSGGPGNLRLSLLPIWSRAELDLRWGPAPIGLFRLLALGLGGIRDTHIIWCNLLFSSAIPVLIYGILRGLGVGAVAAVLTGFVLAAHPFLIAFSGVLERQPTYLFATFGSLLALVWFLGRGGARAFVAFVLGIVLAITSRPEGAHVLVVDVAILLLVPATVRRRAGVLVALLILMPLAFVYVRYALEYGTALKNELTMTVPPLAPLLSTITFSRDFTPLAWAVAWPLGLLLRIRRRAAWVAIAALFGLHVLWTMTGLYTQFVGFERLVATARYESILFFPFAIGMALLCDAGLSASRRWRVGFAAGFVALTALSFRQPYETLLQPFTVDYEYRFLKQQASTLPPEAHVYVLQAPIDDIGFVDAGSIGSFIQSPVQFHACDADECLDLHEGPATYLYIGSSCAPVVDLYNRPLGPGYAEWQRECAATRARLADAAVAEVIVPARKMSWYDYEEPTVRLGLYRVPDSD